MTPLRRSSEHGGTPRSTTPARPQAPHPRGVPERSAATLLIGLQRSAGNAAVSRLLARRALQRTMVEANAYTPAPGPALHPTFRMHHTTAVGQAQLHHAAIQAHVARAQNQPNTVLQFTPADAQSEIHAYLARLDEAESAALLNLTHIDFETRTPYPWVETDWNEGDPRVVRSGVGRASLSMQWVDQGNGNGYFQIYHFEGVL